MNKQITINGQENINETLSIHYIIYRIDNIENGKYYIGQHKTENPLDDYMGSGLLIEKAIKKYSIDNFIKTILYDFDSFEKMNDKEKEMVQLSNCYPIDPMSYNLKAGGYGGQLSGEFNPLFGRKFSEEHKQHLSDALKNRKLTEQHKKHLSEVRKGQESTWNRLSEDEQKICSQKISNALKKVKHSKEWNNKISLSLKNKTKKQRKEIYKKFITTLNNHSEEEKKQMHLNRSNSLRGRKIKDTTNMKLAHKKIWQDQLKKKQMLEKRRQTYNNMSDEKRKEINKKKGIDGKIHVMRSVIKILKKYCININKLDLSTFPIEQYKSISKDKKIYRKFIIEQWLKLNDIYIDIVGPIVWITNGKENKKVNKNDIPDGYVLGYTPNIKKQCN